MNAALPSLAGQGRQILPARRGRAALVRAGEAIKIVNIHGTQVVDTWAFVADDITEFLSMEHMRAWIGRMRPKVGDPLVSNHRREIMRFEQDTSPGIHDTVMAACDIWRFRTLGVAGYHDNCADNLHEGLRALGLEPPEVPSPLNLWMNIPIEPDLTVSFQPPVSKPGDHVVLRSLVDCVVAMSACPQDIVPINGAACTPVEAAYEVLAA